MSQNLKKELVFIKRVIIVSFLLPAMLATALYSMYRVSAVQKHVLHRTEEILAASAEEDSASLLEQVSALSEYWRKEEKVLSRFVRHTQIETLSQSMARLLPLAEFGDKAALHAEIAVLRWLVEEELENTEVFSPGNIF